ncbi:MAG: DNA internalization-related competence protein ComEC/Rec2, partial [Lentisphaerae bacterium]|nr:DNA internalization-related competence protein ComEC/Rec2 [Lentisphaerota bacterium]
NDNENGLSVLCSYWEYDALVTGDMSIKTEERLLDSYFLPDIELLFVSHHGSAYSTSDELLNALRPETAIISVGRNHYGHPSDIVLTRLKNAGSEVFRTDINGDVTVRLG